ncbi:MAG: hypothetical protein LBB85_07675 [Dysgonamonadaceae bacterium]|nr:hypothetical protein [Dysgonamonadaceae bacterium]
MMKTIRFFQFTAGAAILSLLASCASARCECENNRPYKQRKAKISLINHQKNTTFVLQKEGKQEL